MKSYLINLASRPDRLAQATEELSRVGIEFERFEAFTPDQAGGNRPLAFNKSQYYCIKKAVEEGHERFAVFEDDVAFTDMTGGIITDAINQIPEDFDLAHLGCNIIGMSTTEWTMPQKISERIALLHNCWQTHAIIWSKQGAESFLDLFPFYKDEYAVEGLMIFDEWLRQNVYPLEKSFVMRPMVAYQRPDFSDLNQAQSDYTSCFELGNKYLRAI
jgi:GR25 family glycosyltransferase involved in LPS biosynthesis